MLLRGKAGFFRGFFAKRLKLSKLMAKLRQRLIIDGIPLSPSRLWQRLFALGSFRSLQLIIPYC